MRSALVPGGSSALLVLVLATAGPEAAGAAPISWADPAGLCNGESPCFDTLAAAVANAGPPPATVFVFPGTYAESVDLGTMGSALPAAAGDLSVVSVDAAGQPAPGAAVDPGGPGGPGAGPAIFADAFPGPLVVDGLVARSPDSDAILLQNGTAPVHLVRIDASNSPAGNGVSVAAVSGEVWLESSTARLNGRNGFVLLSGLGSLAVDGCVAERNDLRGYFLTSLAVEVTGSSALANVEEGFTVFPTGPQASFSFAGLVAEGNDRGIAAGGFLPGTGFATGSLDGIEVRTNVGFGLFAFAEAVTAVGVEAEDNGGTGFELAGTLVDVRQSVATGNGESGLHLVAEEVLGTELAGTGNLEEGLLLTPFAAESRFELSEVQANDNGESGLGAIGVTPGERFVEAVVTGLDAADNANAGFVAFADRVDLTDVTATGNGTQGIAAVGLDLEVAGCVATGNVTGIVLSAPEVRVEGSAAAGNGPAGGGPFDGSGFAFVDVDRAEIVDSAAAGNTVGWRVLDLAGSAGLQDLRLLRSRASGNSESSMRLALRAGGRLTARCSDFLGNGPAGLELTTDELVDARGNYWGDVSGPDHPGNPAGSGDVIRDAAAGLAGTVAYLPFLDQPAGPDDCLLAGEEVEIPTLGPAGLLLLGMALAGMALALLSSRTSRRSFLGP